MANIDSLEYWEKSLISRSEGTKKLYRLHFKQFLEWIGKTPNELIEMQKVGMKATDDPRENRVLEGEVRAYLNFLKEEGKSISTQKIAYAVIRSFFNANFFPLKMSSADRPKGEAEGSRIPEKSEIKAMIHTAKSRQYRAAILALKDSGLRISDLTRLKWSDITDYGDGFWGVKILTKKRKVRASTFFGPEATDALDKLERRKERIFPINSGTLTQAISLIALDVGLKGFTAHGLRKYFNVELQAARVPREWRYQMMGKKTGAYDENRLRKLFEAYKEAYDHLCIFGADANEMEKVKKDVEALREENLILRKRINGLTAHEAEREKLDTTLDLLFKDPLFEKNLLGTLRKLMHEGKLNS